jgi:hypothetical protein
MCVAYWSGFPLQGVHRFESPRHSDMSMACLRQGSHHIDNLTSLMGLIVTDVVLLNTLNCL